MNMKKYLLFGAILLVLVGCSTVALTGRKQIMLVSDAQILEASNLHYAEFMSTAKLSTNTAATKQIQKIGVNIATAVETYLKENGREADLAGFSWAFSLVEDPNINAFCVPGGKVVFYEGILPICADENGLAVVMGHEIAHAVAKHGNERMSQQILAQTGMSVAGVALSSTSELTQQLMGSVFGLGVNYGLILPYSRKHEYEADRLGMIFMAMAGYDPAGAVAFWERMTAGKDGSVPEFLSTHPSDTKRIQAMQKVLPEAQGYYKK
jgi:predicted Zn-dependent protease